LEFHNIFIQLIVDKQMDSAISKRKFKTGEIMFNKKNILAILSISFLVLIICGVMELSAAPKKHIIVIDPAHGGQDTGIKLTDKVAEKDITLAVAQILRKELAKENNLEVILTRDSDKEVSLEDRRKNIAKIKPDFVLSLHTNAGFGKSAAGFELYYQELNKDEIKEKKKVKGDARQEKNKYLNDSVRLARIIQENLNTLFPRKGRGLRKADLPVIEGLFLPAVNLEMGFATNPEDKKKLLSTNTQTEIAKVLAKSIKSFYR
jgi:N-acetylmuramoyl-L-alanine amidase